jgi:cystathionine beta-lyase/cystathionine gamma-synthase
VSQTFYDELNVAKGPSLGTNFTLVCPYTILAHFEELAFAKSCGTLCFIVLNSFVFPTYKNIYQIIVQCITNSILFSGVDPYLVRVSVGLEPVDELKKTFAKALQKASEVIIFAHTAFPPGCQIDEHT